MGAESVLEEVMCIVYSIMIPLALTGRDIIDTERFDSG